MKVSNILAASGSTEETELDLIVREVNEFIFGIAESNVVACAAAGIVSTGFVGAALSCSQFSADIFNTFIFS